MLRRTFLVLPLATLLANAAGPEPAKIPEFKEGIEALSVRLWEVAEARFESALETPDLAPEARQTILLRLVETHVRAGDTGAALKLLDEPTLAGNPELPFWKAQALTAAGEFGAALDLLDPGATAAGVPHFREARFTRAAILRALDESDGALEALGPLIKDRDPSTVFRARLESASILLDLDKPEEALTSIPPPNAGMSSRDSTRAELLRARAQLEKGEHQAAKAIFATLLEQEGPAARNFRHEAAVGLAGAQLAGGEREAAIDGLLAFIEQQRDSPQLGEALPLLLECLPEVPAADDIILSRLKEWTGGLGPRTPIGIAAGNDSTGIWPTAPPAANELATQALYYLALGLRREGSVESKASARRNLTRLRLEYPAHPLAERALLEISRWDLEDGHKERAAAALAALDDRGGSPTLRAEASLSAAETAFTAGEFELAASELEKAADLLDGDLRQAVSVNLAAARLASGDLAGFDAVAGAETTGAEAAVGLALERALFLASRSDPAAIPALDGFILAHPGHPRAAEARLAAALVAIESSPPDPAFARAQLDNLSDEQQASLPPASLALARIRLAGLEQRWEAAAQIATDYLAAHPEGPRVPEITFELGWARFENRDYNEAHLELAKLAAAVPNSALASPALLLAARSAAMVGTVQAKNESLALFDSLIERDASLADAARLEKARILDPAAAAEALLPWFETMAKDHPLRLIVGLDLCDALYNSAGTDNAPLERALEIYGELIAEVPEGSSDRHEINYQRGRVLEQLPDPDTAGVTRKAEALDVYFSVLQAAAKQVPSDWQWVDRSGVRARTLLENDQRWEAAIAVAEQHKKLASPGAADAAERAKTLKLEHFVWDK